MLIPLTRRARLRVSSPLWLEIDHDAQLELRLKHPFPDVHIPAAPEGYRLRVLRASDEESLRVLLNKAGFSLEPDQLCSALSICLPRGCFIVEHEATGQLVSTMMARHLATAAYPFGGRIDWLATDPEHRKRGLANICARSATRRLIESGYENIWVTTDDWRIDALKIFLGIGFCPVLSAETKDRWQKIYETLSACAEINVHISYEQNVFA